MCYIANDQRILDIKDQYYIKVYMYMLELYSDTPMYK